MTARLAFLSNGALLRSLGSFGFAFTAEWAFTVAIGLVAFADGGAVAVGLVALLRLLPAALLAPVITAYADRMPRERVLMASSAVRGAATLGAAPVLIAEGPIWVVYALAIVSAIAFTPYRASHSALMPSLCRSPNELTSVNVVRGALDSVSVIVGPLVAALLVAVADVASVFVFAGACGLLSAALLIRLNYERLATPTAGRRTLSSEIREGVGAVSANPGVGLVIAFVVLQSAIRGAFTVFVIVVAIDLLDGSDSSVGVLQGAVGIGALLGSLLCTLLVGSRAMSRWLGIAVVLWGAPLAVIGLLPHYAVALVAAGVVGIGNSMVDVTAFTLLARMVPNAVMARVFGVLESTGALAVGLGSLVAPLLIGPLGVKGALITVGVVAPIVCLLCWRRLTAIDRTVAVRTDDIALLRRVPMLRPLPVPVLENLAQGLESTTLAAGETLFEAGDVGDSFYVITEGSIEVVDQEEVVRTMGEGEGFGEIALLGNTTRTMSVRAVGPTELYGISSSFFLPAVTSIAGARSAAEAITSDYLSHAPGKGVEEPQ